MKKRRGDTRNERRQSRVEINLLGDETGARGVLKKARKGCVLPFTGGVLILSSIELARLVSG